MHRALRTRRAPRAALVVLALAFLTAACAPPFPGEEDFYKPPSPLPAGRPGDVIRSRASRFTIDLAGKAPVAGVTAKQVLYRSTDALGQPMAVSGTVLVPTAAWSGPGSRPLVAYAVGTRGVGDNCAPSYTLTQGADYEGTIIKSLTDRGWAVAITDYQGLGTPGLHTYMVGPAQGHAVLDMARAAQRLPGTGLSASTPVGITGYSQGGGAAEIAGAYAPELNVKGSAIGGVPGDLTATAEFLDGTPFVAFALLAAIGLDAAYPELDLDSYLNARGDDLIARSQGLCLVSVDGFGSFIGAAFTRIDDYVTSNPLETPAWQARLEGTRLGKAAPSAPVFQYHALADEIVPFQQAADLRRTWCDKGGNITWSVLPLSEHALGILQGPAPATNWLADRFAGRPATPNCWLP